MRIVEMRSAFGLHAHYALRTIIQLKTDDGMNGLGETYGGSILRRDAKDPARLETCSLVISDDQAR